MRRGPLLALVVALAVCALPAAAQARFNISQISRGTGPNDLKFRVFNPTTGDPADVDYANQYSPTLVRVSIGGYQISQVSTVGDGGYAGATSCSTGKGSEGDFVRCTFGSQGIRAGQGVTISFRTDPHFPDQPSGGSSYHAEMTGGAVEDGFLSGPTGTPTCGSGQAPSVSGVRWQIAVDTVATVSRTVDAHGCRFSVRWVWATEQEWSAKPNVYPHQGLETAFPASRNAQMIFGWLKGLSPETTYHYTMVVTSDDGISSGVDATLRTSTKGPLPPRNYQAFSDETKRRFRAADRYMNYAGNGIGAVAATVFFGGEGVSKTIAGVMGAIAAILKVTGNSLGFLADDPPDPHFRKLAQPAPRLRARLPRRGVPRRFARAARAYIANAGSLRANATSLLDSWERRRGARKAGSDEWAEQQGAATQYFADHLADDLVDDVRLRARMRRAVAGADFARALTAYGLNGAQDGLRRNGLPSSVRRALRRLGEGKSAQRALRRGAARLQPRGPIGLAVLLLSSSADTAERRAARALRHSRFGP